MVGWQGKSTCVKDKLIFSALASLNNGNTWTPKTIHILNQHYGEQVVGTHAIGSGFRGKSGLPADGFRKSQLQKSRASNCFWTFLNANCLCLHGQWSKKPESQAPSAFPWMLLSCPNFRQTLHTAAAVTVAIQLSTVGLCLNQRTASVSLCLWALATLMRREKTGVPRSSRFKWTSKQSRHTSQDRACETDRQTDRQTHSAL